MKFYAFVLFVVVGLMMLNPQSQQRLGAAFKVINVHSDPDEGCDPEDPPQES